MQLSSVRSWIASTRTMLRAPTLSPNGLLNLKSSEDAPRMGLPLTITIDQNIEIVERIVMRDRQISVRRLAYELAIPTTTTVYDIKSNHLGMKKVSTRWVPKLFTPIRCSQIVVKNFRKRAQ